MLKLLYSATFFLLPFFASAQKKITSEAFYVNANKQQIKVVSAFLETVSPKIKLTDFVFSHEEKISYAGTKFISYDSIVKADFAMMPYNQDGSKVIDVGLAIDYDSIKKQYVFLGGDHRQSITLYDLKQKKYRTLMQIDSWWPGVDYAVWFGKNEFALLVWQNDRKLPKSNTTIELHYYNLLSGKKKIYKCPKKINDSPTDFWDFYFDVLYKRKKIL